MASKQYVKPIETLDNGVEILHISRSNATQWHAVIRRGTTIEWHKIHGYHRNDAEAWIEARKQFAQEGKR